MASESVQGRDWNEQFACERSYECAMNCLQDAEFISNEREWHGVRTLITEALRNLRTIGVITEINGQKRLAVNK